MYVVDFSDVFECACSLCYALFDFLEPGKVLWLAEREMKRLADVAPHFLVCGKVMDWPATEDQQRLETFYLTSSYNEVAERLQVTT